MLEDVVVAVFEMGVEVAVEGAVLVADGLCVEGAALLLPEYLEKIKNPKVTTIKIKMAPKIAIAFLFILFLLKNNYKNYLFYFI
jgi:hypothetical protein